MTPELWTPSRRIRRPTPKDVARFAPPIGLGGKLIGPEVPPTPPFVPTDVAGCALWCRADLGATLSGGGTVINHWADQSGVGDSNRDLIPVTSSPGYTASDPAFNGNASISFVSYVMESAGSWSPSVSAPQTLFVVATDNSPSGEEFFVVDNSANYYLFTSGGFYAVWTSSRMISTVATNGGPNIFCAVLSSSVGSLRISETTPNFSSANINADTLGLLYLGSGASFAGSMAEIILYDSALSSGNVNLIQAYLSARYAIALGA